ncbi:uncharacterized protein LOC134737821 isoform X2 [Pongo pygmaeus]|uniref:uncharacterized protein LOC134737821 isoform X2 n=1 Tax=Pongo pygmaeus TaxID=9600 RepID=UPI00300DAC35
MESRPSGRQHASGGDGDQSPTQCAVLLGVRQWKREAVAAFRRYPAHSSFQPSRMPPFCLNTSDLHLLISSCRPMSHWA